MAAAGTWYILVYGESVPAPSNLLAQAGSVFLQSSTPDHHGNSQDIVVTVTGIGFESGTIVELVAADTTVFAAQSVQFDTPTQITATFAAGLPAGTYDVQARQPGPGGDTHALPDALEVTAGGQANLVTNLVVPSALGVRSLATIWIEYANTGTVAMPAPLLVLRAEQNGEERRS